MNYIRRLSIRLRLTLLFVLIFTGSLAIFSYLIYHERYENRVTEFDANLYNYAIDIAESLDIDSYGEVEFDPGIIKINEKIFPFSLGKSYISVMDVNGKVVAHSQNVLGTDTIPPDEAILFKVLKKGVGYQSFENHKKTKYRVINYLLPVLKIDSPLILQIIVPTITIDQSNSKLRRFLIASLAVIAFFSGFIGYAFMGRALRPIKQITDKTKQIEIKNLSERVNVPASKDEISELANTINHLFERLQKSFEVQERFVQDASHQLKTPLAIIKGELEIYKNNIPPSERELLKFLDSVLYELNSLIKLTNDLLILARVDSNENQTSNVKVSIDEVLLTQVSRLSKLAISKNISINLNLDGIIHCQEDELKILADNELVGILFYNLIENAIKYSNEKTEVKISVNVSNNKIFVEVSDKGIGIKEGQEEKIFNRFYRSENTHGKHGSGLGLAICMGIANLYKAKLYAKRNKDIGSTFYVIFSNVRGINEKIEETI